MCWIAAAELIVENNEGFKQLKSFQESLEIIFVDADRTNREEKKLL